MTIFVFLTTNTTFVFIMKTFIILSKCVHFLCNNDTEFQIEEFLFPS